ncbi:M23 family metallopeptidase [Bacillus cereus]
MLFAQNYHLVTEMLCTYLTVLTEKTYTTVYAHMSSRSVSNGQTVKQGTQLGFMGNTGQSYGQHLHFELHLGEWNVGKTNAVDPSPYIGL